MNIFEVARRVGIEERQAALVISEMAPGDDAPAIEIRVHHVFHWSHLSSSKGRLNIPPKGALAISAVAVFLLLGPFLPEDIWAETRPCPKISSGVQVILSDLEARAEPRPEAPQWSGSLAGARVDQEGRLEVTIRTTEITPDVLKELEDHGASIEIYDVPQHIVQAWVPLVKIKELAALPVVTFLDLPNYGVTDRIAE